MSPAIFRRLPMLRQVIAVLLLIVMALGAPGSAMAAEFDLDRLRATPLPSKTNLSEEVIRAEQNARDNIQQDRVDALSQLLARTDRSGKACVNNSTGNWQTSSSRPTNMPNETRLSDPGSRFFGFSVSALPLLNGLFQRRLPDNRRPRLRAAETART